MHCTDKEKYSFGGLGDSVAKMDKSSTVEHGGMQSLWISGA